MWPLLWSVMPFSHLILCRPLLLHQGLFQWVHSSHEVAKVLEFQLQHQSFQRPPSRDQPTSAVGSSHEIKRRLLLGRKVMTNLDSIFRSRDITLPTKFHLVKAMVFPVVMYGCESGRWRKLSSEELMLLNCGVGQDSWEFLGLQGDPTSPFWRRSALGVLWKEWC